MLKFPLPFYTQVSDSSCNFQMAVPHLVCAFFSMIHSSFLDLVPNLSAYPNENGNLMVVLVLRARNIRFKNDAVSNYILPFLSGYHNFNEGACSAKEIEVRRG